MSDVDTSIENFSVCCSNEDYSVFKNGTLEYDPVFGAPLEKVHAFTGELDDVLAIWDKAQADFGIHVTFPYTEDTTEEEIRKSIEGVADLMGVPPMLEAYYAGVPVEDVIA